MDEEDQYDIDQICGKSNRRGRKDGPDYVGVKVKGLKTEIKRVKELQVVEQKNINEMQKLVHQLEQQLSKHFSFTLLLMLVLGTSEPMVFKKKLTRKEKDFIAKHSDFPMVHLP